MAVTEVNEIDIKFDSGNAELDKKLLQNFAILREHLSAGLGVTDTFTTVDGKTVTVVNGIITEIV